VTERILIAEDIDLVAEAFAVLLGTEPGFEIVATVTSGDQVLGAVRTHRPDIVLMDVDMPGQTGIEATAQLRANGVDCKVLLLTALPGSGHVHKALTAGANGYMLKSTTGTRLIETIKDVLAGKTLIDPELAADALRFGRSPLTTREQEILRLLHQGLNTNDVAARLFLSLGTVRNYLSSAMSKLGAAGRIEAVNTAHQRGWI
jgi:two-component system, NarL family, response regulator DesR